MDQIILLADDDHDMRYALRETLTRCGYAVDTATEGGEAIEKFSEKRFDMVITDVRMVNSNGIQVLKEIKKRSPDTPVVLITAYGTIDNAVEAMKLGAFDYLIKRGINSAAATDKNISVGKMKSEIISNDTKMIRILKIGEDVALSDVTVLIEGESGTGKEVLAKFIHNRSTRSTGPFIAINCAAIPDGLLESELFGYERGAFTGALNNRTGKF